MALFQMSAAHDAGTKPATPYHADAFPARSRADENSRTRLVAVIGLMLSLAYLVLLGGAYLEGNFLTDKQGQPIANDFVNVFAAGRLTLDGAPADAYDWPLHKAAEVRALGHDFSGYYGWHYPPPFLFVAAVLIVLALIVCRLALDQKRMARK